MTFVAQLDISPRTHRTRWLIIWCFSALTMCFMRLGYLQLWKGRSFVQASENNHTQIVIERAPRGRIFDRKGIILADDRPVFVALFSPIGISPNDVENLLDRLAPLFNIQRADLERRLTTAQRSKSMVRILDRITREQAFLILQDRIHFPGISLTTEEQRYYPKGNLASHILGYVGPITEAELDLFNERGYQAGDWIGKTGLERLYDPTLQGQDGGFLMQVDARGRQIRLLRHIAPVAGRDIVLTIDAGLQELAQKKLEGTGHPGSAVVLKPQTGEVLAMASSPGFDPNVFLPFGDQEERKRLLNDPDLPLYNRAIQAVYPPGSVFKIISSLAGMEKGVIEPERRVQCLGSITLGLDKRVFRCWKKNGHGWMDFRQALAQSCDVYFYQLGMRVGPERLDEMAKAAGLGQKTGIDLPSEKAGLLPFQWKKSRRQYWLGGETLNYAIGQGALQVTPLQIGVMMSGVANKGIFVQPFLTAMSQMFGQAPEILNQTRIFSRMQLSDTIWQRLEDALTLVVQAGTGVASQLGNITVAGKTGTAQVSKKENDHAWFAAFAPVEKPEMACAVVVEHGGHGGAVAAPIVRDLLAFGLGIKDFKPPQAVWAQGD